MISTRKWVTCLILSIPLIGFSQEIIFSREFDIPVIQNNKTISMPFAGGLNGIQLNTMDINGDDKDELIVWERTTGELMVFISDLNGRFTLLADGKKFFPKTIRSWMLLKDFNADGKKDLFTGDPFGVRVWVNTTTKNSTFPTWRPFNPGFLLLTEGFSGNIPIKVNENDIPAIVDVDADGDLDILNTRFVGNSTIEFHKNLSMERATGKDSLQMQKITERWGNIEECGCGEFSLGIPCPIGNDRSMHTGGKTLNLLDIDNDGDQDLLFGEENCDQLFLLRNKGNAAQESFDGWESFPAQQPVKIPVFPSTFLEDTDKDGVNELVVSINGTTRLSSLTDMANSIWRYKSGSGKFNLIEKNFLQSEMIDIGDDSRPEFFDIDADGDYDLFVTSAQIIPGGSAVHFFENIGTQTAPVFSLKTKDWLGLSEKEFYNLRPFFTDLTADGKSDFVFTATSKENGLTELFFITNERNSGFSPGGLKKFQGLIIERNEVIHFEDLNKDFFPDILKFNGIGELEYYKNFDNSYFIKESNGYSGFTANPEYTFAALDIADLNGDWKDDLVVGTRSGKILIFNNYQNGVKAFTEYLVNEGNEEVRSIFQVGKNAFPVIVNLFGSPYPSVIAGTSTGGLFLFKNLFSGIPPGDPRVVAFPNPFNANDVLRIYCDRDAIVHIFSTQGKRILNGFPITGGVETPVTLPDLPPGLFLVSFQIKDKRFLFRVIRN